MDAFNDYVEALCCREESGQRLPLADELNMLRASLSMEAIQFLQRRLHLLFADEHPDHNTCFIAHNEGIRDDYKSVFRVQDIFYCLIAIAAQKADLMPSKERIPADRNMFWKLVAQGQAYWET